MVYRHPNAQLLQTHLTRLSAGPHPLSAPAVPQPCSGLAVHMHATCPLAPGACNVRCANRSDTGHVVLDCQPRYPIDVLTTSCRPSHPHIPPSLANTKRVSAAHCRHVGFATRLLAVERPVSSGAARSRSTVFSILMVQIGCPFLECHGQSLL